MAVEDKYVLDDTENGKRGTAAFVDGDRPLVMVGTEEIAAADSDGSVYRFFKNVDPNLIPVDIMVFNDAITGGTDYDLGLYETTVDGVDGAVVDKDVLADGLDLSSGHARGSELDGLVTVNIADCQKRLYELAGHTLATKKAGYDIALTANTVGSGAGTVTIVAIFVQG